MVVWEQQMGSGVEMYVHGLDARWRVEGCGYHMLGLFSAVNDVDGDHIATVP